MNLLHYWRVYASSFTQQSHHLFQNNARHFGFFFINSVTMTVKHWGKSPIINAPYSSGFDMVSSFPAIKYEPLYYRNLEHDKTSALQCSKGNCEAYMSISNQAKRELHWWRPLPIATPCILGVTIARGSAAYLHWLKQITNQNQDRMELTYSHCKR